MQQTFTVDAILATEPDHADAIRIYPNPAREKFAITLPASLHRASVELIDTKGYVLSTQVLSELSVEFNTSELAKGMYILRVTHNQMEIFKRVIIY